MGTIQCVTACHPKHTQHKVCYNKGTCTLYKELGVICTCKNINEIWYLGNDCSLPIHQKAFYGGLSVTLICLLGTVGVLTALFMRNKQSQKRKKHMKKQLVNEWDNDEFEWSRSNNGKTTRHGNYGDRTYTQSVTPNINQSFDRHPEFFEMTQPPLHSTNNRPITIPKPQIRGSWDA
ncbi:mucin-3A [Thalassophryne amazonica]|uniref:mucin-3A n=1 Tax=Thalassophryne amazonica TaxID=390379 RepID=UPI001470E607|nr:mucin-3A [Thalassophryne amazonica]